MKNLKVMPSSLPGKQTGLSIIELMIASVIGLFILAGAVTVFSGNNASSSMSTGMARLQDSGRVALDIVANSVRMAGYEGCRSATKAAPNVIASDAPDIILPGTAVWGSSVDGSETWDPAPIDDLSDNDIDDFVKANTDVIYLQHASGRSTNLQADLNTGAETSINIMSNPDQFATDDMLIISDCDSSHIFRATNIADATDGQTVTFGTGRNDRANFGVAYTGSGALEDSALRVMRFESNVYFIQDSDRDMPDGSPIFSLYALDTSAFPVGTPSELIEGVEEMQILYGERLEPSGRIRYVPADELDDMENVVSVQIGILIATANYAASDNDAKTYNIAGVTVGPPGASTDLNHAGDRRLRAAFNTTVQLRNRRNQL